MTEEQKTDMMQYYLDNPIDTLFKLRRVFHKWFQYVDETLLDLCLAVRIHVEWLTERPLTPLWLFIVAASGDRKSETIKAFEDDQKTRPMNHITKNTLASGWKKRTTGDLAPKLDKKLVLTKDFGQFLKIQSKEKAEIWSQMRSAFDGEVIRDTGSGVETAYKGLRWDWLIGTVPMVTSELILKNELGTRELMYRMPDEEKNNTLETIQMKVWDNTEKKEVMRLELSYAVGSFIKSWKERKIKVDDIEVSDETKKEIMMFARFIAYLRASAPADAVTGELTTFVVPEKPTRNLEQLKGMFLALKSLSPCYTDKLALKRLEAIAKSSITPVRRRILKELASIKNLEGSYSPITIGHLVKRLGVGYKTIYMELLTLYQLDFVDYIETHSSTGKDWKRRQWFISAIEKEKKEIIEFILETNSNSHEKENIKSPPRNINREQEILNVIEEEEPTLNDLIVLLNGKISEPDIRGIITKLEAQERIFKPNGVNYKKVL